MQTPEQIPLPPSAASALPPAVGNHLERNRQFKRLALATVGLAICFFSPLYQWFRFALGSELYSYVLLIPAIVVYLGWLKKDELTVSKPAAGLAIALGAVGAGLFGYYWTKLKGTSVPTGDQLCVVILSFVSFFWGLCALCFGKNIFRIMLFPVFFLAFMAPLPSAVEHGMESILQHRSADLSYLMIKMSGTPIFRDGTIFKLPGITLHVAPECSGIRSSLMLFLTSLVTSHFFLRKFWNQTALVGAVLVLGIIRNGFRIFTLAILCVHVDMKFIDSALHHRGGPIFFALSLIPFFLILLYLRKRERRSAKAVNSSKD